MFDAIIIGSGSIGSCALYYLAKAGLKVAGIEQFGLVHANGSHSGESRLIRKAYFEDPKYVPLLEKAYSGWKEIEKVSGQQLFHQCGLAYFGENDHPVMAGVQSIAEKHSIALRTCSWQEKSCFQLPDSYQDVFEEDAGYLWADKAIKAYTETATTLGAEVFLQEEVLDLTLSGDSVSVITNNQRFQAKKVVVATGAYLPALMPQKSLPLTVSRQLIGWVKPESRHSDAFDSFPPWIIADKSIPGIYYGFPVHRNQQSPWNGYLKFAHHTVGELINPMNLHTFDRAKEEAKLRAILATYLPELAELPIAITECMYTNTTDEHFIIDYLPNAQNKVVLAGGFSGHGFKFAPVVGEIITDLVTSGHTTFDIHFLRADRF